MSNKKNLKIYSLLGLLLILIVGIYLNRTYAHIYQTISRTHLLETNSQLNFMVTRNDVATSSLVYVALGDSLTAGVGTARYEESWPYLLAQRWAATNTKIILKSQAVPGYKASDVVAQLLTPAIQDQPDLVTLFIGMNDVHGQTPPAEFTKNYDYILSRLTQETRAKTYLINLPYLGADTLILPPYNYYFQRRTQEFNGIIKELAEKYRVKYVDLYTPSLALFSRSGEQYSADLFHPSASGYQLWAAIIYDSIHQ
jgi:lysophospholipase L1-like esterase